MSVIKNRKNFIDIVLLIGVGIILYILASFLDIFEAFHEFSIQHEHLNIDEIIVVLALLFFALLIILYRRWHVALKEVKHRIKIENELRVIDERMKLLTKILRHDIANDLAVINSAVNIYRRTSNSSMIEEIEKRVAKSIEKIAYFKEYETFISNNSGMIELNTSDVITKLAENYPELEIQINGNCHVFADEGLHSIFDNLISNSIKYGISSKIEITINKDRDFCIIEFIDNGKGIPEEAREHIFEQGFFYGEHGNTGIGLYLVKQIVQSYGGSIQLNSAVTEGAGFIIKLKRCLVHGK